MMRLLVAFSIFIAPLLSVAQLTDFTRQELPYVNVLAAFNGGFESGTAKWTASGGTFVSVTSGSNLLEGKVSTTWNSNGAAQTLTSQAVTVKNGYFGRDCEASIVAQVPSGTATHLVQAHDGTNVLAFATIVSSTQPRKNTLTFPCPSSGTYALRLLSVAADEPLIALDEAYLGLARNVGSAQLITEWEAWTPSSSWTGTITYTGFKRRVGTNQEIKFRVSLGGAPSGTLSLNLPSECVVDTTKATGNNARVPLGNHLIFDSDTGGNIYGTVQAASTTSVSLNVIMTGNASTAPISNITATTPITFASGDTIDGYFSVPCVGWAASTTVMPDAQGWYVDANISGANPSLGVAAVSSYTEITNASLTMTPRTNSAPAGIMCSSTNAAASPTTSTSTCSAGSESLGANFNIPRSGTYEVCAYFSHFARADQGESLFSTFQLIETPTNAQTLTLEGGTRITSGLSALNIASGTLAANYIPNTNCSIFNWSAGIKGVRLMFEQRVTGTPNDSLIAGDADTSGGQQDIRITVKPVSQQQQAILANSVSSANNNGTYFNSAQVGSTGTVTKETGDWISGSCVVASAVATCTLVAGAFSTDPACHATIFGETTSYNAVVTSATTSTVVVRTFDTANAASASAFGLTCSSPR